MSKKEFPCSRMAWNEVKQRDEMQRASVICNYRCDFCGFNPKEQKRRMREGRFVKNGKGGRRLLFPPAAKGEDAQ